MIENARATEGMASDFGVAAAKASPPVAVSASAVAGMPLSNWVVILTVVYLALQIAYLVYKFARDVRRAARDLPDAE